MADENAPEYPAVEEYIADFPAVVKESKSGYKTTEFWLTVITSLMVVVDGVPLPEKFEGVVIAVLGAAYALSRGLAKKGIPHVEEDPAV